MDERTISKCVCVICVYVYVYVCVYICAVIEERENFQFKTVERLNAF